MSRHEEIKEETETAFMLGTTGLTETRDPAQWANKFIELYGDRLPGRGVLIAWFGIALAVGNQQRGRQ